jgi:transposase InsO family protein
MNLQAAQSNHRIASRSRRAEGFVRQASRRVAEQAVCRRAATLGDELRSRGWRLAHTADRLGRSRRTLGRWRHRSRTSGSPLPRGRPCQQSPCADRLATLQWLDKEGAHMGLPSLRAAFPTMPRCELRELQQAYRREFQATHRRITEELTWHWPGRVWAMDHSEPPSPIDGVYPAILSIRDLASGMQLAWRPVADQTAETTLAVLKSLIDQYGPPLVIKSDNGSAFKSQAFGQLLAAHGITWLPSPPVTPCYNGSCEAANGSMKVRTRHFAAARGTLRRWTSSDLEKARQQANERTRPEGHLGPTPAERWRQRLPITEEERAELSAAIEKHRQRVLDELTTPFDPNNQRQQHQAHRQAVRRALLDVGLLTITRRSIPLPLRSKNWDKFS